MTHNRSDFLLEVAESLEEKARVTETQVRDVTQLVGRNGYSEFRDLSQELRTKTKEIWKVCLEAYQRTLQAEVVPVDLHCRLGCVQLAMENFNEAFSEFDQFAVSSKGLKSEWKSKVMEKAVAYISTAESYRQTKAWLQQEKAAADSKAREDSQAAVLMLVRDKYWTAGQAESPPTFAPPSDKRLIVTPIIVEADSNLYPTEENWDKTHPLFVEYAPAMRARIQADTGVSVPGTNYRSNEGNLPANSYIISINEVPLVLGSVQPGRKFCSNDREAKLLLNSKDEELPTAFNPRTGAEDGTWIQESDWPYFQKSAVRLWDEFEYIVFHVERVLRDTLSSFFGIQEAQLLLEQWVDNNGHPEPWRNHLVKQALPNNQALTLFVQVLQRLLNEHVPLTNLFALLSAFWIQSRNTKQVTLLAEKLRSAIKEQLPGNNGSLQLYQLSQAFEDELKHWQHEGNGKIHLAIPPDNTQNLLAAVRAELANHEQGLIGIVTRVEGNRPCLKRLIEIEFPRVTVLAASELRPDLLQTIAGEIAYPAP